MPRPLPLRPARQRFYGPITIVALAEGRTVDGEWFPGEESTYQIAASWQAPAALREDIAAAGDAGLGNRRLWSRAFLPFYDIGSGAQTFVLYEGRRWRVTDRQYWGPVSQGLYVYDCTRSEEPADAP